MDYIVQIGFNIERNEGIQLVYKYSVDVPPDSSTDPIRLMFPHKPSIILTFQYFDEDTSFTRRVSDSVYEQVAAGWLY
jgi:hypothetical protein